MDVTFHTELLNPTEFHLDNSLYLDQHDAAVESAQLPNDHIEQQNVMRFPCRRSASANKFH